ncbi:MAG: VOC family protein [Chitinophagales bacterium]
MPSQIFVNLPVKDLNKSVDFFTKLGFTFNPQFTDENATCMIVGENNYVMLLVEPFFKSFSRKEIPDAGKTAQVIVAISTDNRQNVKDMVSKAIEAGGKISLEPKDHGFMYQESFEDLDGHLWEVFYMDESAIPHP